MKCYLHKPLSFKIVEGIVIEVCLLDSVGRRSVTF